MGNKHTTYIYTKPTDTFPLLDFMLKHPVETKVSIIYSQARKYRLLTTYYVYLAESFFRPKLILPARGYPNHIINSKFTQATTLSQPKFLSTLSHNKKNNPALLSIIVITYHRENRHIKIILDRNWHLPQSERHSTPINFPNRVLFIL